MFDPRTTKYAYPLNTDGHYMEVKTDRGIVFDENYPYFDKSKSFLFKKAMVRFLCYLIVFPLTRVRLGLIVKGRKNLRKNKKLIKGGVISVCNHVHLFDYLGITLAIKPVHPNVLVWDKNVNGDSGPLVRLVGGVPIPENNPKATHVFLKSIEEQLDNHGWIHLYPEGSMWEYYAPIRPFKKGAAFFACRFNRPIIPMAYSYRKPTFIRKIFFKQPARFTLNIGKPLFPNNDLPLAEREHDLTVRMHEAVCDLAGYMPMQNMYEPVFFNSKRVDYYTDTYGK